MRGVRRRSGQWFDRPRLRVAPTSSVHRFADGMDFNERAIGSRGGYGGFY